MSKFNTRDLVWAKMKGFPAWPGIVVPPPDFWKNVTKKDGYHCIYFFGSKNYGWIEESKLQPYHEKKDQLRRATKTSSFKEACKEIEKYFENGDFSLLMEQKSKDKPSNVTPEETNEKTKTKSDKESAIDESQGSSSKKAKRTPLSANKTAVVKPFPKKLNSDTPNVSRKRLSSLNEGNSRKRQLTQSPADSSTNSRDLNTPNCSRVVTPLFGSPITPHSIRRGPGANLLERPSISKPDTPPLNIERISETLLQKNIKPTDLKIGFLGLGNMGSGIVKNLMNSGHKVIVWNRSPEKTEDFQKAGAEVALTPSDVVSMADVTICCVNDPAAARELVIGNCGVKQEMCAGKSYIEMTGIDPGASADIAEIINNKGGRYLEVRLQGSKKEAEEGSLLILAAGDRSLFTDCASCFQACGRNAIFLGDVGNASKVNLVIQLIAGVSLAGLAEGLALAQQVGVQQADFIDILESSKLNCQFLMSKAQAIQENTYATNMSLSNLQKDIKLSLNLADSLEQPMPLLATANEIYKHTKRLGYGDHDAAAIFVGTRF